MRLLLLTFFLLSAPGCTLVVAGAAAGGVLYLEGALEAELDAPVPEAAEAAVQALEKLGLRRIDARSTGLDAEIVAETADGTELQLALEARGQSGSHIEIRVGTFGDEEMSRRILDEIEEELEGR